jgi:hypothetical protein
METDSRLAQPRNWISVQSAGARHVRPINGMIWVECGSGGVFWRMSYLKACGSTLPRAIPVQSKTLCHFKCLSIEIMLSTPEGFEVLGVDESDLLRLCSSAQPLLAELVGALGADLQPADSYLVGEHMSVCPSSRERSTQTPSPTHSAALCLSSITIRQGSSAKYFVSQFNCSQRLVE